MCPLDYLALSLSNIASVSVLLQAAQALRVPSRETTEPSKITESDEIHEKSLQMGRGVTTAKLCNYSLSLSLSLSLSFSVYQYYQAHNPHNQQPDTSDVPDSSLERLCLVPHAVYLEDFPHDSWVTIN